MKQFMWLAAPEIAIDIRSLLAKLGYLRASRARTLEMRFQVSGSESSGLIMPNQRCEQVGRA